MPPGVRKAAGGSRAGRGEGLELKAEEAEWADSRARSSDSIPGHQEERDRGRCQGGGGLLGEADSPAAGGC